MTNHSEEISLLSKLRQAELAKDPMAVVKALDALLEDDFEKAAKTAISGAKKHLTKGILCSAYCDAFWSSQTPVQFVEGFGTHMAWRRDFWKSCFGQPKLPTSVIRQALKTYPKALEEALRNNQVFLREELWQELKPELKGSSLEGFVDQCERIRNAVRTKKANLARFDELLGKIAPESIIIQFAAWLERRYFETNSENEFEMCLPEYLEILESSLIRNCNARTSIPKAKTPSEISNNIKRIVERITRDNSTQLDCYPLFEAIERQLDLDFGLTLFVSHGAEAVTEDGGI